MWYKVAFPFDEELVTSVQPITGVFVSVFLIYLLGLAFLSYWSYKKTDSLKEFLVMGGSAGGFLTGLAYFATQFSMSSLVGVPGVISRVGFAGLGIILPVAMWSMAFGVLLAGRRLQSVSRRLDLFTLPDYLASRYGSPPLQLITAALIIVFLIPYMAAQIMGAGVIFNVFTGYPYQAGVGIMGLVVIAYCMVGGMRAAVLTDALQGVLMLFAAVATFTAVLIKGGGMGEIVSELANHNPGAMSFPGHPDPYLSWKGYVSLILTWTLFSVGQPQLVNKYLVARNYHSLLTASLYSGAAMTLTCTTIWTAGAMAPVLVPGIDKTDWVMPVLLAAVATPLVASFIEAGILAAGMSTIDSVLIMVGAAFSRDIYQKLIGGRVGDQKVLRVSRAATLIVGGVALSLALAQPATIFELVLFSWSAMGVVAIPVLAGLYWKRATRAGAAAALATGLAALLASTFRFESWTLGFHPIVFSGAISALALIFVSLMTSPPAKEVITNHFRKIAGWNIPKPILLILVLSYFVVWIPVRYLFPWKEYLPGFWGIPVFVWVWLAIQVVVGLALYLYRNTLKRVESTGLLAKTVDHQTAG